MWTRKDLKDKAKKVFYRNYWKCVLVSFILGILATGVSRVAGGNPASTINKIRENGTHGISGYTTQYDFSDSVATRTPVSLGIFVGVVVIIIVLLIIIIATVFKSLVGNIFIIGGCRFFLENQRKPAEVGSILQGFQSGNYWTKVLALFLKDLYIALWTLLFIVPGVIKSYEYAMMPYLLAVNPQMSQKRAFALSKAMMDGEKWNAFVLDLSFIGWMILSMMTCGVVGLFYANPYRKATWAEFYQANREKVLRNNFAMQEEIPEV